VNENKQPMQQISEELSALRAKVSNLEQGAEKSKPGSPGRAWIVVVVCLVLGVACVLSVILKSWFGEPKAIDWVLALLGVVLAGFSLFKTFEVTKEGLKVEMADLRALHSLVDNLTKLLMGKT